MTTSNMTAETEMKKVITWQDAFIYSGFKAVLTDSIFTFEHESRRNRKFLSRVLKVLGSYRSEDMTEFVPETDHVDKQEWFLAIDAVQHGAECGDWDDLRIMDPYMGGLVRWLNEVGIKTALSCDGHGEWQNLLTLINAEDHGTFSACLALLTNGELSYNGRSLVSRPPRRIQQFINNRDRAEALKLRRQREREGLIELAKKIHTHQGTLKKLVEMMRKASVYMNDVTHTSTERLVREFQEAG